MLNRRLQVLLDEDRHRRLDEEARRRGVPVAVVVREAIDTLLPVTGAEREAAAARILDAEPMPVPAVGDLRVELDELRGRRG